MPSELLTERRGTTLVLTISDVASRNTLSAQVIAAGIEALDASEASRDVGAGVGGGVGRRRPRAARGARGGGGAPARTSAPAATCWDWSSAAPRARRRSGA
jgi:hypothetical protein